MIAVGIAATTAVAWVGAPFIAMNRRGTIAQRQVAAMSAVAPVVVIPAPRRSPEAATRTPASA